MSLACDLFVTLYDFVRLSFYSTVAFSLFFYNDTATTEIYTLSLHDALPISRICLGCMSYGSPPPGPRRPGSNDWSLNEEQSARSEEHTSELQSLRHLVCRLLLEKKKKKKYKL